MTGGTTVDIFNNGDELKGLIALIANAKICFLILLSTFQNLDFLLLL